MATSIVAGFRAAQHELDTSHGKELEAAHRHLEHIAGLVSLYQRNAGYPSVKAAADSFDRSLARVRKDPASSTLNERNANIRRELLLGDAAAGAGQVLLGTDASYAKHAIGPALDVLTIQLGHALAAVEENGEQRDAVVERVATELGDGSRYILLLLDEVPADARHSFRDEANRTAAVAGRLLRWVRTRTPHKKMEDGLVAAVHAFDEVLERTGGRHIEDRAAPVLTERALASGEKEHSDVTAAVSRVGDALEGMEKRQLVAIETFRELAEQKDIEQPDFAGEVIKAVLMAATTAMVDHFTGSLVSRLMAVPVPSFVPMPAAARLIAVSAPKPTDAHVLMAKVVKIGTDSLRTAIVNTTVSSKIDPKLRALTFFAAAMKSAASKHVAAYRKNVTALVEQSAIGRDELDAMTTVFEAATEVAYNEYLHRTTAAWASYLAQSRLGTEKHRNATMLRMDDYFGAPGKDALGNRTKSERVSGTDRSGGDGVLVVSFHVDDHGAPPELNPVATKIIGVNSELTQYIFETAGHDFERVALPKEVHVSARFGHATIALDEHNRIRDVTRWQEIQPYVQTTPYGFYKQWCRNVKVK